jgi:sugar transferase (PEP-CTERM/EpsH1 system associated)
MTILTTDKSTSPALKRDPAGGSSAERTAPVRVMHLLHTYSVGGMEVGITKLVNALDSRRVTSSICSCRPGDSLKDRLRPDVRVFELNRREGNDLVLVAQLYRLLRRERPDVLHTHRWATLGEGLLAARLAGVPIVVHGEHGTLETRDRNRLVQRWLWNRVDRVLSVSSRLGERMSDEVGFPLERIHVIRNGVDLQRYHPRRRAEARAMFGFSEGQLIIGTVGRLVPVKDQATLLRALACLRQQGLRFSGVIAGGGRLRDELMALARTLGLSDVHFLGNRDDVERVLAAYDIFVLSSESEGLSNTIQEAMSTALPVVATHVGGADELVEDGRTGFLVPPRDAEALAARIRAIAEDAPLRLEMGAGGRRRAEAHFGIDRMIRDYERLYLSLAARRMAGAMYPRTYEA